MPKWCAVPACRTGSRTEKTCSVFRVPRDPAQLKKWEDAIPGIVKLNRTDVVCEKHFDTVDVAREWIKFSDDGQVIARAPYKYPQLKKLAVPTRFCNIPARIKNCPPLHEYAKQNFYLQDECSIKVSPSAIEVSSRKSAKADSLITGKESNPQHEYRKQNLHLQENPPSVDTPGSDKNNGISLSAIDAPYHEPPVASTFAFAKSAKVPASPQINKLKPERKTISSADFFAYLPESWSCGNIRSELVHRTLFSYTITKIENGVSCPVTQKSVVLNVDGTLQYFVYGHPVDLKDSKLQSLLNTAEMLPDILNRFRGMNVCSGLGDINVHLISASSAYLDYVDKWRSKSCTLLYTKKRCDRCMKLKKNILQTAARLKNRTTINRIGSIMNPVIQRKISPLRVKIRAEKSEKLRTKNHSQYMKECSKTNDARAISETGIRAKKIDQTD